MNRRQANALVTGAILLTGAMAAVTVVIAPTPGTAAFAAVSWIASTAVLLTILAVILHLDRKSRR